MIQISLVISLIDQFVDYVLSDFIFRVYFSFYFLLPSL
jgi:hypothetical protein